MLEVTEYAGVTKLIVEHNKVVLLDELIAKLKSVRQGEEDFYCSGVEIHLFQYP